MKGKVEPGTVNYTFVGKPNNGSINSNTILPGPPHITEVHTHLQMDADAFITDSAGSRRANRWNCSFSNTLSTHVLKDYQGGYGVKKSKVEVLTRVALMDFISQI
jgi:hypothetical protein